MSGGSIFETIWYVSCPFHWAGTYYNLPEKYMKFKYSNTHSSSLVEHSPMRAGWGVVVRQQVCWWRRLQEVAGGWRVWRLVPAGYSDHRRGVASSNRCPATATPSACCILINIINIILLFLSNICQFWTVLCAITVSLRLSLGKV